MIDTKPSKWGKVGKVSMIIATILLCLFGLAYSLTDISEAASHYDKNRDEAKKLGLPFSSTEINRLRIVPEEDNAAVILTPILGRIKEVFKKYDYKDPFDAFVKSNWSKIQADYPSIERASRRKTLVFKRDLRNPYDAEMPEFANLRNWIGCIISKAKEAANKGNRELATSFLATAARLGVLIDKDQFIAAITIRTSTIAKVQSELKRWIPIVGKDPSWRHDIHEILTIIDKPYDLRPGFRSMHWNSLYAAEIILGVRPDDRHQVESNYPEDVYPNMESMKREAKYFKMVPRYTKASLSRIDEYYVLVLANYPSDLYDFAALDALSKKVESFTDMTRFGWRLGLSLRVTEYVAPFYSLDFRKSFHREFVQTNLLYQTLALLESGKSPEGGFPLKGSKMLDMDGAPLRSKKTNKGWILYSIGRDGVDDGGDDDPKRPRDFVVHLPK
jgi:hypothetical protein